MLFTLKLQFAFACKHSKCVKFGVWSQQAHDNSTPLYLTHELVYYICIFKHTKLVAELCSTHMLHVLTFDIVHTKQQYTHTCTHKHTLIMGTIHKTFFGARLHVSTHRTHKLHIERSVPGFHSAISAPALAMRVHMHIHTRASINQSAPSTTCKRAMFVQ